MRIFTVFFTAANCLAASANEVPIRALLVTGGCCHDYPKQTEILREGIQARANVQVDTVRSTETGTQPWFPMYEDADWAKGYDVIIHDECAADIKDMTYVGNIVNAHKNGVPAVNLHCAMHCYRTGTDLWFEFLGLQSSAHGQQKPITLDFGAANDPITRGMKDWTTINEELYNNVKIFPTARPLVMGNQTQDNGKIESSVVAWTNDFHGTKVFSTTLGHQNETVADARYLDLVVRGLLWSCGKLSPDFLKPYAGPKGREEIVGKKPQSTGKTTFVSVKTSSEQGDNWGWKAVDSDPDTRWCAADDKFPQSLQLGFETPRKLTGLKITWEAPGNSYRYKLEGSLDGEKWTQLTDATANAKPGNTTAEFPATDVKFLRITCTGTSGGWASIREIAALGDGGPPMSTKKYEANAKPEDPYAKRGNSRPKITKLTPDQEAAILRDVKVADGFDLKLFATPSAANYPVYVAAAPNGDLYVSSDGNGSLDRDAGRGRIVRLRDTDGDGRADQVTEFVKNVDSPRGLVWDHDRLYVVHPPNISCYIDYDGDGQADEEKTLITGIAFGFDNRPADHTTNGLTLGIDGWLYIAGGDFGMKDAVGTDGKHVQHRAGGVLRFRPDGTGLEIFATGTRNILATPISPLLDLFARDNTNDGGGWDVRFHHFTGLEDHGYPRLYMNFSDEIVKPLADYGGGSGCGGMYLSEPGIPTKWNDAPLTCDWGTGALWHHTVTPFGATFQETAKPEPLIKMTRPTDADVDGMSRIYQASWKGATFKWEGPDVGYIVRISPTGYTPEPLPDFEKASDAELIHLLESPSQERTLTAQRTLLRRLGTAEMKAGLLALAGNADKELPGRVAALYALTQRGIRSDAAAPVIQAVLPLAADPKLGRFVLRALGDAGYDQFSEGKTTAPVAPFSAGLQNAEPRTRLEALVGATRQHMTALAPKMAALLGDADPVVAHTAFRGLAMLNGADACFAVLDNSSAPAAQRTGALRALERMHTPEAVAGLVQRIERSPAPADLLGALCRLYFHEGEWKGDSWGTRPDTRGPYYQPEPWSETPKIAAVLKAQLAKSDPAHAAALAQELRRNRIEFKDALPKLMELAKTNPAVLPELVAQLAVTDQLPADAISALVAAARGNVPAETKAQAVVRLAATDSTDGCLASLEALESLSNLKDAGKSLAAARTAFLGSPKLENHHLQLEQVAEKLDGSVSAWADSGLLALAERKTGSPEARELSAKALKAGWANPKRRVQILGALQATSSHFLDDEVRAALNDSDSAVAEAAKATARVLKLQKKVEDKGPLIGTLKPEDVIAAVMKTKGDADAGKQEFTSFGCTACHAASLDEVQKGPYLGSIAKTYTRAELAANILDPGKTIAQGFATELFTLKDGTSQMGFVTLESAGEVKVRNIAGQESTFKTADIAKRDKLPNSMMPPGLVNGATVREFASLLDYLEALSK